MNLRIRSAFIGVVIICSVLLLGCSKTEQAGDEIVMPDVAVATEKQDETVVIDDVHLGIGKDAQKTFGEKPQDTAMTAADGTQVSVMHDGYGNKIETRSFPGDPVIRSVVKTTAANGETQIEVFGLNGQRKVAPPEMAESIMTVPGSQIARNLNISRPIIIASTPKPTPQPKPTTAYVPYQPPVVAAQPEMQEPAQPKPEIAQEKPSPEPEQN